MKLEQYNAFFVQINIKDASGRQKVMNIKRI